MRRPVRIPEFSNVDGYEAGLAELGAPESEDAGVEIDVVAVEGQRFAEPQARWSASRPKSVARFVRGGRGS